MMSGGLLEKAKSQANDEESTADEVVEQVVEEISQTSGGGLLERAESKAPTAGFDPSKVKKGVAASIVTILILFIAYQAFMGFSLGGYSIYVGDIEINESDDRMRVQVYIGTPMFKSAPDADIDMKINYGGQEVWSGTFQANNKLEWFEVPFSDFYQGNSRAAGADGSDVEYTISVTIDGSGSSKYLLDGATIDRTIEAADGELSQIAEICDCDEKNDLDHLGASMRVGMGAEDPVASNTTGILMHVNSDYTVSASLFYDGSDVYTFPEVTVDGDVAQWNGGGGVVENAWLDLKGDGVRTDAFGGSEYYIPRDDFYQGDGCYTISITVTPDVPFGDSFTMESDEGFEFFWDYNENRDVTLIDADNDGEEDDEREPYKAQQIC